MLAPIAATLLSLWLILWGVYHVDSPWVNGPLLVCGLGLLMLSTILSHEGEEDPPVNRELGHRR